MSHVRGGRRGRARYAARYPPEENRRVVDVETGTITGALDSEQINGEFKGTTARLLVGYSTSNSFSSPDVFTNTEKGVAIGFTESTPNFSVFHNDGAGSMAITPFPVPKDAELHKFQVLLQEGSVICRLEDTYILNITTKIPSLSSDTLKLITYGNY
jgi:hypothetical protein